MKWRVSGAALLALVLATITGCSVNIEGDETVSHEFGSDYFGAGGMLNLTDTVQGDAFLAGGCHLNRPVRELVAGAGLSLQPLQQYYLPKVPRFLGYVTEGVARRSDQ